jgi:hypothetical protein
VNLSKKLKNLIRLIAIAGACGLALWFILPISPTLKHKAVNISQSIAPTKTRATPTNVANDCSITLRPEDQNMPDKPVFFTGPDGLPEERSRISREKTLRAMTKFAAHAKQAGLKFDAAGEARVRVRTGDFVSIADSQTTNVYFNSTFTSSDKILPIVDSMSCIGTDMNGVDRDIYKLMSGDPKNPDLKALADQSQYPIVSSSGDVYPMVTNFLVLQVNNSDYRLNKDYRLQFPLPLPFIKYEFVTSDELRKVGVANVITITVRVGGTDLQPGEAELAAFEDTGVGIRGQTKSFPKPPASLLGRP